MPSTLGTTNYNGLDYVATSPNATGDDVNPPGLAQTISEELRTAYLSLVDRWPNVVVVDSQAAVFGTLSLPYTSAGLMSDQIHHGQAGQYAIVDYIVENYLGVYPRRELRPGSVSLPAIALSPYAPWTVTPAVLDDPDQFARIAYGSSSSESIAGSRQSIAWPTAGDIAPYDIVRMPDGTIYQLPANASPTNPAPSVTRISSNANAVAHQAGLVEIFRQLKTGDANMNTAAYDKTKRFRKFFRVVSATATAVTLRPVSVSTGRETSTPAELDALIVDGNQLYLAGAGSAPTTLTAAQVAASGSNLVVSSLAAPVVEPFDYTPYVGRLAAIIGTQSDGVAGGTGAAGPASGNGSAVVTGRDAVPTINGTTTTSTAVDGTEYVVPFVPLMNMTVDKIGIEVTTAAAGAVARLGIRTATGFLPDAVLLDSGTVDCGSTGYKQITGLSQALIAGTLYGLSVRIAGGTPGLRIISGSSPYITLRDGIANEGGRSAYSATRTTSDAALAAWGSTYIPSNFGVLVRLHAV